MSCEFCGGVCFLLGSIPFDRNNAGVPVINSNTPMEYFKCNKCHSITCPEMQRWNSVDGPLTYNKSEGIRAANRRKLSDAEVVCIREEALQEYILTNTVDIPEIDKVINIAKGNVRLILNGTSYKNLAGPILGKDYSEFGK